MHSAGHHPQRFRFLVSEAGSRPLHFDKGAGLNYFVSHFQVSLGQTIAGVHAASLLSVFSVDIAPTFLWTKNMGPGCTVHSQISPCL